jgi:hypothetical protein
MVATSYDGPEGLELLKQRVAEAKHQASVDFYLDKMLEHPDFPATVEAEDAVARR